jgi:hypothetical protein
MWLHHADGRDTLIYEQPDATPASYTVLNFEVDNIEIAVDQLAARGVHFGLHSQARGRSVRLPKRCARNVLANSYT